MNRVSHRSRNPGSLHHGMADTLINQNATHISRTCRREKCASHQWAILRNSSLKGATRSAVGSWAMNVGHISRDRWHWSVDRGRFQYDISRARLTPSQPPHFARNTSYRSSERSYRGISDKWPRDIHLNSTNRCLGPKICIPSLHKSSNSRPLCLILWA